MNVQHRRRGPFGMLWSALAVLIVSGCSDGGPTNPTPAPQDNAVLVWNEVMLQTIRDLEFGPPMNARALACLHTAMYDAWAAYDDVAIGVMHGGALRRPIAERTLANKKEAISYAAYRQLVDLFPGRVTVFDAAMTNLGYDPNVATTDVTTPAGIGNVVSAALAAYRHGDGSNQLNGYIDLTGYTSVNGPMDPTVPGVGGLVDPSKWQPLIHHIGGVVDTQTWDNPNWRNVIPFAMQSPDEFLPPSPAAIGSPEYDAQIQELLVLQQNLTDSTKVISEYWADGPTSSSPPGHFHEIAQWVSRRDANTLDEDIKMFFLTANAVMDASIAVWHSKSHYDYARPITAIRWHMAGQQVNSWRGPGLGTGIIDADMWMPYQPTDFRSPPFAEYTSGHSAFSMASATVLKLFTGSDAFGACDIFPAGTSQVEPGLVPAQDVTLCWDTFTHAAEEAAMSRLYGGIHFRQGDEESGIIGAKVGQRVWDKAQTLFQGTGTPLLATAQ